MTTLNEMVDGYAGALGLERGTVWQCARHLREAKLIRQGGRGFGGAHMSPRDATNLLLGLMASDQIQESPQTVRRARALSYQGGEVNFKGAVVDTPPPYPFAICDGAARPQGDMLDHLIDSFVRFGGPSNDQGVRLTNLFFRVFRPGDYAELELDDSSDVWAARYGTRPSAGRRRAPVTARGMTVSAGIAFEQFVAIAAALRGYEPRHGEVVNPAYPPLRRSPRAKVARGASKQEECG